MTKAQHDPILVRIADLHPTQVTVGFREVAEKRFRWRARIQKSREIGAAKLVAPIVIGPEGKLYLIDRHHLACAVKAKGVDEMQLQLIADMSALDPRRFWRALEAKGWCRPYDAGGARRPFSSIPDTLGGLRDDPFRSLASALRRAGGFKKEVAPFSEFAWADFLRHRIRAEAVEGDFAASLDQALILARIDPALHLPGWRPAPGSRHANSALGAPPP